MGIASYRYNLYEISSPIRLLYFTVFRYRNFLYRSPILNSAILLPLMCIKTAKWVANSVDPDQMPHSVASKLGLQYLLRHVCLNIYGK